MFKHTPGPWGTRDSNLFKGPVITGNGKAVAVTMYIHEFADRDQEEEVLANANLISAAPDLLEVVKKMHATISFEHCTDDGNVYQDLLNEACAAIAKAEGRNPNE